jgi:predicted lipoprotein
MNLMKITISALVLTTAIMSGCGGERKNDPVLLTDATLATAIRQAVDNSIVPAAVSFSAASQELNTSVTALCATPTLDALSIAQGEWSELAQAWYRLLPYLFGPLNDNVVLPDYLFVDSLRQRGNDYTATVRNEITSMVEGDMTLDSAYFDALNFQKVGLLALEVGLFQTLNESTDNNDILTELTDEPRKCDVILGLGHHLNGFADTFSVEWQQDYQSSGSSYRDTFLAGETEDGSEPLTLVLTRLQEHFEYLKQRSVADQAANIADQPWVLMSATLTAAEQFIEGVDGTTSVSFADLMTAAGATTALASVRDNFSRAKEAIADQSPTDFYAACALLDGNLKREIPDSLAVQLGINFTDGD